MKQLILITMIVLGAVACKKDDDSKKADPGPTEDTTLQITAKVDGVEIHSGDEVQMNKIVKFTIESYGFDANRLKMITMLQNRGATPLLTKHLSGTYSLDTPSWSLSANQPITFTTTLKRQQDSTVKTFTINVVL